MKIKHYLIIVSLFLSSIANAGSSLTPKGCEVVAGFVYNVATLHKNGEKAPVITSKDIEDKELLDHLNSLIKIIYKPILKYVLPEDLGMSYYNLCFEQKGNINKIEELFSTIKPTSLKEI